MITSQKLCSGFRIKAAPEYAVDEMSSKDVKHDKDQFSNAGTPHVGNHHVGQQGGVPE